LSIAASAAEGTWKILGRNEVDEVAQRAWAYVSASSKDYRPSELVGSLLSASAEDVNYLRALVQVRHPATRRFLLAVPGILERLAQTTEVQIDESLAPIGAVDWPATVLGVVAKGHVSSFVIRHTDPHRDLPENRLLRCVLNRLKDAALVVTQGRSQSNLRQGWLHEVDALRGDAQRYADHPLLQAIVPKASHTGLAAARASRIPGYAYLAEAYDVELRVGPEPTEEGLHDLLSASVLLPEAESRAYELLVLFRMISQLEGIGYRLGRIGLIGLGDGHVFELDRNSEIIHVYYQQSPFESIRYRQSLVGAGFSPAGLRPDIVLVTEGFAQKQVLLFEMKCSNSTALVSEAIVQLFGYRYDLADLPVGDLTSLVAVTPVGRPSSPSTWPLPAYEGDFRIWTTDQDHLSEVLNFGGQPL
jgi:hypothetical protein